MQQQGRTDADRQSVDAGHHRLCRRGQRPQEFLDMVAKGFTAVTVPTLVRREAMVGTGLKQQARSKAPD